MRRAQKITIRETATGKDVAAQLVTPIQERNLRDYEEIWQPILVHAKKLYKDKVEDSHWTWRKKLPQHPSSFFRSFAVECEGTTQGLMTLRVGGLDFSWIERGEQIAYVEFIAAAPWNRRWWPGGAGFVGIGSADLDRIVSNMVGPGRRFGAVGRSLMRKAIWMSRRAGLRGRVGLHALSKAAQWYTDMHMTRLGVDPDPAHEFLEYFEFTRAQTKLFLAS